MAEYGKIRKDLMTAIADAIREKKDTTAILTPAQMAVEIDGIVTGDDLPNAEDVYFGNPPVTYEYGLPGITDQTLTAKVATGEYGYAFAPNTNFAVYGFRYSGGAYVSQVSLWDGTTQQAIAVKSANGNSGWQEIFLDSPVNVLSGHEYAVTVQTASGEKYLIFTYEASVVNSKMKKNQNRYSTSRGAYPSLNLSVNNPLAAVDIIIGPPLTESVTTEYKVQADTMTSIADEVIRITGATETMTTAEIITALQGVAVQTTE